METISRLGGGRAKAVVVAAVALALTGLLVANAGRSAGPPVIRLTVEGAATMTAEADAARDLALAHPAVHRFELAETASFPAGEASAWRLEPPSDLTGQARELARGLGLEEELRDDPSYGIQVGPEDGSGPTLWVHRSGDWGYSDPGEVFVRACAEPARAEDPIGGGTSDAPDGAGGDGEVAPGEPAPCAPPDPPEGVPDEHEARRAAEALLDQLDLPGTARVEEVHADEWGAWALASLELDGVATDLRLSVAFGSDAAVTSASGTLARPIEVDRYPTIDAEAARARLEDHHGGGAGGIELLPMPMPAEGDVDVEPAPVSPAEPASPGGSETPPASPDDPETPDAAPEDPDVPLASPEVPDAPVGPDTPVASPADPGVTSSAPTRPGVADDTAGPPGSDAGPQERIVTLTSFEPTMMTTVDADGTVWLLPGVAFADEDGGVWPVLTVSEDYLETTVGRPGADDAPRPVEPGTGGEPGAGVERGDEGSGEAPAAEPPPSDGEHEEPGAGDDAEVRELAEKVVGLTEEEAVAHIEEAGHVVRVTARDGESFPVTDDWRTDRVNLRVEDGRVVEAKVG